MNWIDGAGVRPEAVRISKEQPGNGVRSFLGSVQSTTFLGNCVRVHAQLADGAHCTAEIFEQLVPFAAGDTVYLWWNAADELRPGNSRSDQ